jgi:hypothetical protein
MKGDEMAGGTHPLCCPYCDLCFMYQAEIVDHICHNRTTQDAGLRVAPQFADRVKASQAPHGCERKGMARWRSLAKGILFGVLRSDGDATTQPLSLALADLALPSPPAEIYTARRRAIVTKPLQQYDRDGCHAGR